MPADLHAPRVSLERRLAASVAIAAGAASLEIVGSWFSGSLALLSDAGHVGTDAVGLGLALVALRLSLQPHTARMSFGYHRMEVLAALTNGILMIVIATLLGVAAYGRLQQPPPVRGGLMLLVGLAGFGANLAMLGLLRTWARQNINARGAFLHAFGDTLGSAGVVIGAGLIQLTGVVELDVVVSLAIVALILASAVRLLRDSVRIILEASPSELDPRQVADAIESTLGVRGMHDLHLWTVTSGHFILTAHIRVLGGTSVQEASRIIENTAAMLRDRFGIAHVTLQTESVQDEIIPASQVKSVKENPARQTASDAEDLTRAP